VVYYTAPETMSTVCFAAQAPVISETGFQDAQGIRLGVDLYNPSAKVMPLEVRLSNQLNTETEPTIQEETIELQPGESKRVELLRPLSADQLANGAAAGEIRVRQPRRGNYYQRDVRWRLQAPGPLWED
jgi:hypothetical protein